MQSPLQSLREQLQPLFAGTGGIDSWISSDTPSPVLERLLTLDETPLSHAQLNQLLVLCHEAGVSDGFFEYYWLENPEHPYAVDLLPGFRPEWCISSAIRSLEHLRWGLYRFYVDGLLYFGNIRAAYRFLRGLTRAELGRFFSDRRVNTERLARRGAPLPLQAIATDERYLISEMACKSLDPPPNAPTALSSALTTAYARSRASGKTVVHIRDLVDNDLNNTEFDGRQGEFAFTADEMLDEQVASEQDVLEACARLGKRFSTAHASALENTRLYLSMVEDLDVYVATSMRNRDDFRSMSVFCDEVFGDEDLRALTIRHFNPTLSATEGHEDKELIECLMVKCAKALVWFGGLRDSFGKDAEAAMAMSLGKPVIFYCNEEERRRFFQRVHPLSRIIDFSTGVAVGAMVVTTPKDVSTLLHRIFSNAMQYELRQPKPGYLVLTEEKSQCNVRLQTSDALLRETFWNYYHAVGPYALSVPTVSAPTW